MKKKLSTENIANELEGASLFFTKPRSPTSTENTLVEKQTSMIAGSLTSAQPPVENVKVKIIKTSKAQKQEQLGQSDTVIPRHQSY